MTYEEYVRAQRQMILGLIAALNPVLGPLQATALTTRAVLDLIDALYPVLEGQRRESSVLGRQFFDAERQRQTGSDEIHPIYLAEYRKPWMAEALQPALETFRREDAPGSSLAHVVNIAAKEVENGGRTTVRRGVESEPRRRRVRWARVAGGGESCAFCLMLISRGPVYFSARAAGLNADDDSAKTIIESGSQRKLNQLMTRWHPKCDCKVVPVYDNKNWPGRDQYLLAERIWREAEGSNAKNKLKSIRDLIEGNGNSEDLESIDRAA